MLIKNNSDLIREIRRVQKEKNITDEKIAFYGNLSKGTVSQLMTGASKEFTFKTILKIAKALDCDLELSFKEKKS